jgi:putative ABC transport system permease protein
LILSSALGVAGVVCSVNYGAGGSKQLLDQIEKLGTNVLIITPAQSRSVAGRARTGAAVTTLVERDYSLIRREIPARDRSSALVTANFWTKAGDLSKNATVLGCEPDFFAIKNWAPAQGVLFDAAQERAMARVALLGHGAALDLFGEASPLGSRLLINRVPFEVIGVLSERGQGLDVSNEDSQIYVPLRTQMRRLMNADHYGGIVLEIRAVDQMDDAAENIRALLHQSHRIRPSQADDFQLQNQKTLLDTQAVASARLAFFLRWIGGSALAVSGLGILGITWIAVKERTREIGTRRALGATARDVFLQFLFEGVALALLGGLTGLSLSWPVSLLISKWVQLPFVFERVAAMVALTAATFLNLAFSVISSSRAAGLNPSEAIRYE